MTATTARRRPAVSMEPTRRSSFPTARTISGAGAGAGAALAGAALVGLVLSSCGRIGFDLGDADARVEPPGCPPECANGCADGQCEILDPDVTPCPAGLPCQVDCSGTNACFRPVDCSQASACAVTCGIGACAGGVECGAGPCRITCNEFGACSGPLDCSRSSSCEVTCGAGACGAAIACGQACAVECIGLGSCIGGVDCAASCACDVTCGLSSCADVTCPAPACIAGAGCSSEAAPECDTCAP